MVGTSRFGTEMFFGCVGRFPLPNKLTKQIVGRRALASVVSRRDSVCGDEQRDHPGPRTLVVVEGG